MRSARYELTRSGDVLWKNEWFKVGFLSVEALSVFCCRPWFPGKEMFENVLVVGTFLNRLRILIRFRGSFCSIYEIPVIRRILRKNPVESMLSRMLVSTYQGLELRRKPFFFVLLPSDTSLPKVFQWRGCKECGYIVPSVLPLGPVYQKTVIHLVFCSCKDDQGEYGVTYCGAWTE